MELIKLNCNNCSAQIETSLQIKYFNCSSCGSSLTIKEAGNSVYTEVVIEENQKEEEKVGLGAQRKEIFEKIDLLLIESKIARFDRDWKEEQENHKILRGVMYRLPEDPNTHGNFILIMVIICIGVVRCFYFPDRSTFLLVGLVFLLITFYLFYDYSKFKVYQEVENSYLAKRTNLLVKLSGKKK